MLPFRTRGRMVSVLASSLVDRGFIGGVMVSVLASSLVDRGFIGGVKVRRALHIINNYNSKRFCNTDFYFLWRGILDFA
jgi:hypothetical protein